MTATETSTDRRPRRRRRHTSLNAGLAGLVGAAIGAVASFGGTYLSLVSNQSTQVEATRREAFVSVVALTSRFTTTLEALAESTPRQYPAIRHRIELQLGPLNAAIANVQLLTDGTASASAHSIKAAIYGAPIPANPADVDLAGVRDAVKDGNAALSRFLRAARSELRS